MTMTLVAIAAALFVMSLAAVAMEMESMQGNADILSGKITAIDTANPTKSLTLQSVEAGISAPKNEMNIFVNDETAVKFCDANKSLKEIQIGSKAHVMYYERAGVAVADFIYVPC
jgi:hypothetical protein